LAALVEAGFDYLKEAEAESITHRQFYEEDAQGRQNDAFHCFSSIKC
jgi:hypothetical protein